jgi:hypothetical protein
MAFIVRRNLMIANSMKPTNIHRRFRFGKVLAERGHVPPFRKFGPVGPPILPSGIPHTVGPRVDSGHA